MSQIVLNFTYGKHPKNSVTPWSVYAGYIHALHICDLTALMEKIHLQQ